MVIHKIYGEGKTVHLYNRYSLLRLIVGRGAKPAIMEKGVDDTLVYFQGCARASNNKEEWIRYIWNKKLWEGMW